MKIYISGPMTGLPDLNVPAFNAAAAELRAKGLDVVNPAELNPNPATSWHERMLGFKALCDCDTLVLLSGWKTSRGAQLELNIARALDMRIATIDGLLSEFQQTVDTPVACRHNHQIANEVRHDQ